MFLVVFASCFVAFLVYELICWLGRRVIKQVDKAKVMLPGPSTQRVCCECYLPVHRYRINFNKSVTCANCISEGK
jgi:hypothetical protein